MYSFNESEKEVYDFLQGLFNVMVFFTCLTKDVLSNGYLVTSIQTENNNGTQSITYSEENIMNSKNVQLLCDLLVKLYFILQSLCIGNFEMTSSFDFSLVYLKSLSVTFYSIVPMDFVIPSTLTSLNLDIQCDQEPNKIPKLSLNNAQLIKMELNGFRFLSTYQLQVIHIPNTIILNNCSNISINLTGEVNPNEYNYIYREIHLNFCSNILIDSPVNYEFSMCGVDFGDNITIKSQISLFEITDKIVVKNIPTVEISDENCFDFQFECVEDLTLKTITPLSNIQFSNKLQFLFFGLIPNDNNIRIPITNNKHPKTISLEHTQLFKAELNSIQHVNFIIPTTIKTLDIKNCEDTGIKTTENCVLDNFYYEGNTNCNIQNLKIGKDCGIVIDDIVVDDNFYYCEWSANEDSRDYEENELNELMEDATIIGPYAFQHKGFKHIELPNSVKEIRDSYFCISITSIYNMPMRSKMIGIKVLSDKIKSITLPQCKILPSYTFEKFKI
ncbi:hypothetical protein QTN25_008314 [Entamoeba marina]